MVDKSKAVALEELGKLKEIERQIKEAEEMTREAENAIGNAKNDAEAAEKLAGEAENEAKMISEVSEFPITCSLFLDFLRLHSRFHGFFFFRRHTNFVIILVKLEIQPNNSKMKQIN